MKYNGGIQFVAPAGERRPHQRTPWAQIRRTPSPVTPLLQAGANALSATHARITAQPTPVRQTITNIMAFCHDPLFRRDSLPNGGNSVKR